MELLVFGHAGARVLVFPTSMGRFYEWEDRGMVGALGEHLRRGWVQLYCVDSVDGDTWYARHKHPGERAWLHLQYERYLLEEVLPFTSHRNPDPFLITAGASFGAYHAMNLALRHPHRVGRVLAMAGLYDIKQLTRGYTDENVHANDPSAFLRQEHDEGRLAALRRIDFILSVGRDDPNVGDNEWLSHVLWEKGIWHALRLWDGWAHDWPWWRQMVQLYVGGCD